METRFVATLILFGCIGCAAPLANRPTASYAPDLNCPVSDGLACTGSVEMLPKENVKAKLPDNLASYAFDICQTAGQKDCINVMCEGSNLVEGCPNYPNAEYHDFIDDRGVYHANFTDPQDKWRCEIIGTVANGWGSTTAFTLACAKPHDVTEGKPK